MILASFLLKNDPTGGDHTLLILRFSQQSHEICPVRQQNFRPEVHLVLMTDPNPSPLVRGDIQNGANHEQYGKNNPQRSAEEGKRSPVEHNFTQV
jgi:hypothetical protein